jgi:predicted alpha/beta superfamily hydrolase
MNRIFGHSAVALWCGVAGAMASPVLKDVELVISNNVGFGNEVCVTGPHPLLGGNDPLKAPKLAWNPGNIWRGTIALPAGEAITYRFIQRDFSTANWSNASNAIAVGSLLSANVPAHVPAPWTNKTVFLHSPWTNANIYWRNLSAGDTNWTTTAMAPAGDGRQASERLFRGEIRANPGAEIEFVFNNGTLWSNAPTPPSSPSTPAPYVGLAAPYNFRTTLDQLFVQDGSVFNYRPPTTVSAPQTVTTNVGSTVANIPGRPVTILLPRGYAENTWKKYPVVYFHDGQNVFFPGGPFGTWDADRIANYETSQGRMREAIMVGIPNDGANRLAEYMPNGDAVSQTAGKAASYLQWLVDNVTPTLDFNFRTLGDAANTIVAGSSMGGLVSDYIGFQRPDRFGTLGIFSPAYWAGPNYLANRALTNQPVRRYISMGTAESSGGQSNSNIYWQDCIAVYSRYIAVNEAANRDVLFTGVAGGLHNELAWSRLLPQFFGWALDPWREANPLALELYPPELRIAARGDGTIDLLRTTLRGCPQSMITSSNLSSWTTNDVINSGEAWDAATDKVTTGAQQFWRLRTVAP